MPYLENIHLRLQLSANDYIGQLANDFAVVPHRRVSSFVACNYFVRVDDRVPRIRALATIADIDCFDAN